MATIQTGQAPTSIVSTKRLREDTDEIDSPPTKKARLEHDLTAEDLEEIINDLRDFATDVQFKLDEETLLACAKNMALVWDEDARNSERVEQFAERMGCKSPEVIDFILKYCKLEHSILFRQIFSTFNRLSSTVFLQPRFGKSKWRRGAVRHFVPHLFHSHDIDYIRKIFKYIAKDHTQTGPTSIGVVFLQMVFSAHHEHITLSVTSEFVKVLEENIAGDLFEDHLMDAFISANREGKDECLATGALAHFMEPAEFGRLVGKLCERIFEDLGSTDLELNETVVACLARFVSRVAFDQDPDIFWEMVLPTMHALPGTLAVQVVFGLAADSITPEILAAKKGTLFGKRNANEFYCEPIDLKFEHALWAPLQLYSPGSYWPTEAIEDGVLDVEKVPEIDGHYSLDEVLQAAESIGVEDLDAIREFFDDDDEEQDVITRFYAARIMAESEGAPLLREDYEPQ